MVLGIEHGYGACTYIFDERTGILKDCRILACDFEGKTDYMRCALREYNLDEDTDWVFIGDSKNDVPIAEKAPISFAIDGHEKLLQVVTYHKDALGAPIMSFKQIEERLLCLSESDFLEKWKKRHEESVAYKEVVSVMSSSLQLGIAKLFSSWLGDILPNISKNWWDECVAPTLNFLPSKLYDKACKTRDLSLVDLPALLSIAKSNWFHLIKSSLIKREKSKKDLIYRLHKVRNRWMHIYPGCLPEKREISDDLLTMEEFIQAFNENDLSDYKDLAADIKRFRLKVKDLSRIK